MKYVTCQIMLTENPAPGHEEMKPAPWENILEYAEGAEVQIFVMNQERALVPVNLRLVNVKDN